MSRAIDSENLYKFLTDQCVKETGAFAKGVNKGLNIARSALRNEQIAPTLTSQNEWISVEDRLPEPGDLIVYADNTVWGYQYGICRVCGKEKAFDYWMLLQDPPNNRLPEGEEDNND